MVDTADSTIVQLSDIRTWMGCKWSEAWEVYLNLWSCKTLWNSLPWGHRISSDGYLCHYPALPWYPQVPSPIAPSKHAPQSLIHSVNDWLAGDSWKWLLFSMINILLSMSTSSSGLKTLQNSSLEGTQSLSLGNNMSIKCHADPCWSWPKAGNCHSQSRKQVKHKPCNIGHEKPTEQC